MTLSILIPSKEEPNVFKTIARAEELFPNAQIITCNDREGKGKGWAIRQALQYATGDVICFIDGDFDIDPIMITRLIPFLDKYDIVLGSKIIRGRLSRRLLTKLSRLFIHTLFGFNFDSQTGLKLFKKEAIPEWVNDGFMFDLEIISRAHDAGLKIVQVPIETTPYGATSKPLRGKGVFKCLKEALKIWMKRF